MTRTTPTSQTPAANELVSVIVPCYNVAPYLDQCLASIRAQTHKALEIICLNDGSTDESLAIMQRHAADDDRIIVVDKKNEGYGASCNRGLDLATGAWIAIVEPDDWIEPEMYARMLRFAAELRVPCDMVKTPYWRIVMPDTPQQRKINCSYRRRIKPSKQPFAIAEAPHLLRHHPSIWSALYRASFLRDSKIRFHEIPGAGWADNPFLADTLLRAQRIAYLDTPFYCYREETSEQEASSMRRSPLLPIERWNDVEDVVEELGIADPIIVEEVYRRGFTNLGGILRAVGEAPEVMSVAKAMFKRMDAQRVFESKIIAPASKRLFAETLGIECPSIDEAAWKRSLISEFFYNIKNAGIGYTFALVKRNLK